MNKLILLALIVLMASGCSRTCLKSHASIVHHNAWYQTIPISIYHPAYDSEETICDEYLK